MERDDTSPLIDLLEAGRLDVAFLNATVPGSALRSVDLATGPLEAVLPGAGRRPGSHADDARRVASDEAGWAAADFLADLGAAGG